MPNLTSVGLASGVPNSGTGTVSTLDALMALLGEVQASPTAYTALDRLKTARRFIVAASSAAITRPANTTAYTAGDAVSNSATAGSVTSGTFLLSAVNDDPITIEEILMLSTDTGIGGKNMRLWLFNADPTASSGVGGGDNAAFSQKQAGFVGTMIGTMLTGISDGSVGRFLSEYGSRIIAKPVSGAKTLFWLLQTIDAFTPSANSTTFTPTAKGFQGYA